MKLRVLFISLCIFSLLIHSEGYISVNIDPEDLNQITDFIQTFGMNDQSHPITLNQRNRACIKMMKDTIFGIIQLIGVMLSLVGANYLSMKLTPEVSVQQYKQPEIIFRNPTKANNFEDIKMCKIDYGCNKNLCWKTCNSIVNGTKLWCYASSTPGQFHRCSGAEDCSQCWDCIERCHT